MTEDEKLDRIFAKLREPTGPQPSDAELDAKWKSMVGKAREAAEQSTRKRRLRNVILVAFLALALGGGALAVRSWPRPAPDGERVTAGGPNFLDPAVIEKCAQAVGFDEEQRKKALELSASYGERMKLAMGPERTGLRRELREKIEALLKDDEQRARFERFCR